MGWGVPSCRGKGLGEAVAGNGQDCTNGQQQGEGQVAFFMRKVQGPTEYAYPFRNQYAWIFRVVVESFPFIISGIVGRVVHGSKVRVFGWVGEALWIAYILFAGSFIPSLALYSCDFPFSIDKLCQL